MRVSLQWLQELVSAPGQTLDADALAERLSLAGFEVDAIEDLARAKIMYYGKIYKTISIYNLNECRRTHT